MPKYQRQKDETKKFRNKTAKKKQRVRNRLP
jgi:hypothetical protein